MPLRDQIVDAGQQILDLFVAPIGENGLRERDAAAAAAAIIDAQNDVALGREHLRFELISIQHQGVFVLAVGSAMDPQNRRILAAGDIGRRLDRLIHESRRRLCS